MVDFAACCFFVMTDTEIPVVSSQSWHWWPSNTWDSWQWWLLSAWTC